MSEITAKVLIIGGGATGTAIARDLSLRGISCLLVEQKDINSGASGANHGLLHSGARYVYSDLSAAVECKQESLILKQIAPHCIENTGGLFVAVEGDDERYIAEFPALCSKAKISVKALSVAEARHLEPALSAKTIAAFQVEDAAIDPFMLSLEMMEDACRLGSRYLSYHKVIGFRKAKQIDQVVLADINTKQEIKVSAELVINASGAWAGEVAALAGIGLDMIYSKGSLIITQNRLATRVINRLRTPADADIIVPGGTVSVLGTTSILAENLDNIRPTTIETDYIVDECAAMIPILQSTRIIRAYAGVRPLVGVGEETDEDSRSVSRGFALIDHEADGIENFITITGGKLTTCRLMAEKTADLVCRKLGVKEKCGTRKVKIGSSTANKWTEPGLAPSIWIKSREGMGGILCECEMVPASSVANIADSLRAQGLIPDLKAIGLRSRIGKGPCQGAFCSVRVASFLYDKGYLENDSGLKIIHDFIENRWRGIRPVISAISAEQVEMMESLHCNLFGLELAVKDDEILD
ncbi:anaerobic glycerol-3-phosphate dehydrogenase subunit A [bacterium]|nr:anaerobic glycerol-3-phosphate dehydrogenase subunit A [bacterium]